MNLSDKEILELNALCNAVVDQTLTDKQKDRLSELLRTSQESRQFYVRAMGLSASLHSYAAEMQIEGPDGMKPPSGSWSSGKWFSVFFALAALVMLVIWLRAPRHETIHEPAMTGPIAVAPAQVAAPAADELVAQLTGSKGCEWKNGAVIQPGQQLHKDQKLELVKGLAEITFDCGAQVVLEGPASFNINSAWSATLSSGSLRASLPPEALGFSISNPTVEVVDNGTEFTMLTDASGISTDVLVLKGEVVATPKPSMDSPIVLTEKESRRFAVAGVSKEMHADELKLVELAKPMSIDHFVQPTSYAHWAFNETDGNLCKGMSFGLPPGVSDLQLHNVSEAGADAAHTVGHFGGALKFSGKMYAQAAYPGISDYTAHTILLWVKVPRNASVITSYAMMAWGVNNPQLGSHPIQICWNRNASDGMVGALRTDYGGGFALGQTQLRDGAWHHIAVVFVPRGNDPRGPMGVKEYVDGRLEAEGKPSPPGSDVFQYSSETTPKDANGDFWLGCRVGPKSVPARWDRFSGEISDLFVVDRALEPQEIMQVMTSNHMQF